MKNKLAYLTGGLAALLYAALVFWLVWMCYTPAKADAPPEMDYMELMLQSVVANDPDLGHWAEEMRAEKIAAQGLDYPLIAYDDLDLLSRLIQEEAGADGISFEWRRDVGAVALNRVDSPEFPDNLYDVVYQRGQYSTAGILWRSRPTRLTAEAALAALEGDDDLPEDVVFQANFVQGSGAYRVYYLAPYGNTYLCRSSRPELY